MRGRAEDHCRVCGLDVGEARDEYGVPQYVICDCCGNESGIGDETVSQVRELRGYWVACGASWYSPQRRPDRWDVLAQLTGVPEEWR